jgi:hypothetical protein
MSHHAHEDDEGRPRETEPNPTQQRMDETGPSDAPVDASWDEGRWGETEPPHEEQEPETLHQPHEGEEGQDLV